MKDTKAIDHERQRRGADLAADIRDAMSFPPLPPSPADVSDLILETREHVQALGWGKREQLYTASQVRNVMSACAAMAAAREREKCIKAVASNVYGYTADQMREDGRACAALAVSGAADPVGLLPDGEQTAAVSAAPTPAMRQGLAPPEPMPIWEELAAIGRSAPPGTWDAWSDGYEAGYQAGMAETAQPEPKCWGMPRSDGSILDVICLEEHAREPGAYTVPLYTAPKAPQPAHSVEPVAFANADNLREALKQESDTPLVAWSCGGVLDGKWFDVPLYTAPPPSEQRVPLDIKEINALPEAAGWWPAGMNNRIMRLIRAVERKHGITAPKDET